MVRDAHTHTQGNAHLYSVDRERSKSIEDNKINDGMENKVWERTHEANKICSATATQER